MLNAIWLALILIAVLIGGCLGTMAQITDHAVSGAKDAITLALGLAGVMTLWLGMMRLAEKSGLVSALARLLRPLMKRLFPDVPPEHPAMGAMVMNMAANMLGLSNAATPLGIRAMQNLAMLNRFPGTASNAMCTFLAINTSSIQLIPASTIAILSAAKSVAPTAIIGTAFLSTVCATAAAITSVKLLEKLSIFRIREAAGTGEISAPAPATPAEPETAPPAEPRPLNVWRLLAVLGYIAFMIFAAVNIYDASTEPSPFIRVVNSISILALPLLLSFFPLYAALRGVAVYEEFVEGAKEGFQVAVRIMPFLVGMLVAIGMLRGSGAIDMMKRTLGPWLDVIHFPADLLPLVIMRPLSGSGSTGIFAELVQQFGPDSMIARMAATILGSTETTFYVLTVYFGAVAIRRTRHAVVAGLIADATGVIASIVICRAVFSAIA